MTKQILVKTIADRIEGMTQKQVAAVLEVLPEVIKETLINDKDEKITLPGIGIFKVKKIPERRGVSALGEKKEWVKPAHSEISFKIMKSVKQI